MKHSSKATLFITALLAISSCNRFDRTSPLGSDVIGELDSSAIAYDGTFYTEKYIPSGEELLGITDPLSRLHRYTDSLARNGGIQGEVVVGQFQGEESFGYLTFVPKLTLDTLSGGTIDTTIQTHSPAHYVDSLLKSGKDSVTTALTFAISHKKHSEEYYNLELSTGLFVADSTQLDTTKRHVMQNVLIPGNVSRHTVDLPFHFYKKKGTGADTAWLTKINGSLVSSYVDTVKTTKVTWKNGTQTVDSTSVKPILLAKTDTLKFQESSVRHHTLFTGFSESADSTVPVLVGDVSTQKFFRTRTVSGVTVNDTVFHSSKTDVSRNGAEIVSVSYEDTIKYPKPTVTLRDTVKEYGTSVDSFYTITDTVRVYTSNTVYQSGVKKVENIVFSRAYTGKDTFDPAALDTLNIILKNITAGTDPLFHMAGATLRIIGHKGTAKDTLTISPKRSTMTVFNKSTGLTGTEPTMSGGLEQFVRLKMNTASFWQMMNVAKYQSILFSTVQIPVSKAVIPAYRDSTITIRYMLHGAKQLNGELLATPAKKSKSVTYHQDSAYIKLDITDFLVDQRYGESTPTPDTYLYLWIDGGEMGRVAIDATNEYQFTYIVQNKQN